MLFDNRSHSVRLSGENPGMNHLELPLGAIWATIHDTVRHLVEKDGKTYYIEGNFSRKGEEISVQGYHSWDQCAIEVLDKKSFITEQTQRYLTQLLRKLTPAEECTYRSYQSLNKKLAAAHRCLAQAKEAQVIDEKTALCQTLEEQINQHPWQKCPRILEVPAHLQDFALCQIPYWIKNALDAAWAYKKEAHYDVQGDRIVPINYNETGVLQDNMVWSDGLTQFLQIKEGIPIDPEGISTNFISNVEFFQRYDGAIYGLTGTLGEKPTHDFLKNLYKIDMVIIPPYKEPTVKNKGKSPYLCKELAPLIFPDQETHRHALIEQVLIHAQQQRGVLVIFKYIKEVNVLYEGLKEKYPASKITTYTGQSRFEKKTIDSGEIILATNIAGRGTDIDTSQEVEKHGGMYVVLTFLPESARVEMQNAGRTGRAGKKGMVQMILQDPANRTIETLKEARRDQETSATAQALKDAKHMLQQDAIFNHFCTLENDYLPLMSECAQLKQWDKLTEQWETYAAVKLARRKVAVKVIQCVAKKKQSLFEQALAPLSDREKNNLTAHERQTMVDQAADKSYAEMGTFEADYKNAVLKRFCQKQKGIFPDALLKALEEGKIFEPPRSDLAKQYNWGLYERQGFEEAWGLWLKEKHFAEKKNAHPVALFRTDFASSAHKNIPKDKFVKNPFYYVLKGNNAVRKGYPEQAIISYDRAIKMDPLFSVNALYGKAHALLMLKENKGGRLKEALEALEQAEDLITDTYEPQLLAFHTVVAQGGDKTKIANHVGQQLSILNEQRSSIQKACKVIEKAQKDRHKFTVEVQHVSDVFKGKGENYEKTVREAAINGLTEFFTLKEVTPIPWWSVVGLTLIAATQLIAGFLIATNTGNTAFIYQGVSDLITAVKITITGGNFDWASWARQKAVSLAVSLICMGWNNLKMQGQAIKETTKALIGKEALDKTGLQLAKTALKKSLTTGVLNEVLFDMSQFAANKLFMEKLEQKIISQVERSITNALTTNPLVCAALAQDVANGDHHWQDTFLNIGFSLLVKHPTNHCVQMVLDIIKGVTENTIPNAKAIFQVHGVAKLLETLTNYTNKFIKQFNEKVAEHTEVIMLHAQQTTQIATASRTMSTLITSPPVVDIEDDDIPIDVATAGSSYCAQGNQGITCIPTSATPSTPASLAIYFKKEIASGISDSIRAHLVDPAIRYGVDKIASKVFKSVNAEIAELEDIVQKDYKKRYQVNVLGNQTENQNHADQSQEPLDTRTEQFIDEIETKDSPQDEVTIGATAVAFGRPIRLFDNATGKYIRTIGRAQKGPPIDIIHTMPSADNPNGHFTPKDGTLRVTATGENSCFFDAIAAEQKTTSLHIRNKVIKTMRNNPDTMKKAVAARDALVQIAPEKLRSGGTQFYIENLKKIYAKLREDYRVYADKISVDSTLIQVGAPILVGLGATLLTGGTGVVPYVTGMLGATTVSIYLDETIKEEFKAGNIKEASNLASYHLPFVGSGRRFFDAARQKDSKGMLLNGGFLLADVVGAKLGTKRGSWFGRGKKNNVVKMKANIQVIKANKTKINIIDEKRIKHTFRNSPGHFIHDTPVNRKLLERAANDPKCELGPDKHGNTCHGFIQKDGSLIWAITRNGKIINGGVNQIPRVYNSKTGFAPEFPPKKK